MICPKCKYDNLTDSDTCLSCGVIFAKIKTNRIQIEERSFSEPSAGNFTRPSSQDRPIWSFFFRTLALLGLLVWSGNLIFSGIAGNNAGESVLHLVNLPFHEAGHVLFRPFGKFVTTLGGTLGQLLIPLICGGSLLLKAHDYFGALVCAWWFGENFLDIAPYINDARAGVMPLLGGNTGQSSPYGFHDWEYLLTETGLLHYDHALAKLAHGAGAMLMIAALVCMAWILYRQFNKAGS